MSTPVDYLRAKIELKDGLITHNGIPCRVVISQNHLQVGCSNVSMEAALFLMAEWARRFGLPDLVLQSGKPEGERPEGKP